MSDFSGSSILITGASGFVGGHLTRQLAQAGARVHGLGLEPPRVTLPLEQWHSADLADLNALRAAIEAAHPAMIVHLAGQASAGKSFEQPVETFRANAHGTCQLLVAVHAAAPGARVLAIGSGEIYGPQPAGSRVAENAPIRPVSPYALSKAAADLYAQMAAAEGLDIVRTRSFAHAGPGQDPRFAVPSWARQIVSIERGDAPAVLHVGNLDITRDLCDVRDVARAYAVLLLQGRSGEAYNVCRGEGVTLRQVLERMTSQARVPLRVEVDSGLLRPADVPYLVGDPSRIEGATGWRAVITVDSTLDAVLEDARLGSGVA